MEHFESNRAGLKLIVAYKLVKAALTGGLALLLLHEHRHGRILSLADRLAAWTDHLVLLHGAGHALSAWLLVEVTARNVSLAIALVAADTVSTAIEGVGLHYRQRWAAWWVVVATGALVPLELWGIFRHPTALRLLVLAVNVAILAYLVRRVLMRQRPGVPQGGTPA